MGISHQIRNAHLSVEIGSKAGIDPHPLLSKLATVRDTLKAHVDGYDGSEEWSNKFNELGKEISEIQKTLNNVGCV